MSVTATETKQAKPGRPAHEAVGESNILAMKVPAEVRNELIRRAERNRRALGVEAAAALKRGLR